jgi:hypothetical protein
MNNFNKLIVCNESNMDLKYVELYEYSRYIYVKNECIDIDNMYKQFLMMFHCIIFELK